MRSDKLFSRFISGSNQLIRWRGILIKYIIIRISTVIGNYLLSTMLRLNYLNCLIWMHL